MALPGTYTLDRETLKLNAYRLICLFYANKEISRLADPDVRSGDAPSQLEEMFFPREMTRLLLTIAIEMRVFDDQMKVQPADDPIRKAYEQRSAMADKRYGFMMFADLTLRETCNKIIHAHVVELDSTDGSPGSHEADKYNWLGWSEVRDESPDEAGPEPAPIKWEHLSGHIRLGGQKHGKVWWHLLNIPQFIEGIHEVLTET